MDNGNINPRAQKPNRSAHASKLTPTTHTETARTAPRQCYQTPGGVDSRKPSVIFFEADLALRRGDPPRPPTPPLPPLGTRPAALVFPFSSPFLPLPPFRGRGLKKGVWGTPVCVCVRVCLFRVRVCAGWHNFSKGESVMSALRLLSCKMTKLFLFFVFRKPVLCYVSADDDKKKKREKVCEGMLNC